MGKLLFELRKIQRSYFIIKKLHFNFERLKNDTFSFRSIGRFKNDTFFEKHYFNFEDYKIIYAKIKLHFSNYFLLISASLISWRLRDVNGGAQQR